MRESLARWIGEADALRHLEDFAVGTASIELEHLRRRGDDYYIALVGELFDRMRRDAPPGESWARLANALAQVAADGQEDNLRRIGVSKPETLLFAAAAFYCGGFPASAHLTIRRLKPARDDDEAYRACYDLLARPSAMTSRTGSALVGALRRGDMAAINEQSVAASTRARSALEEGRSEWIPARLHEKLLARFQSTNVRAVLPDGASSFWTPFVASLLNRKPPSWEFFPSQIEAIERGLLESLETFSLQMPTGAGKTALCETLLYWHAKQTDGEVAIFLVPYRALAAELRSSVVRRLNSMGVYARCAYGGTVPSGDEVRALDDVRVVVATPEALSGLLVADAGFFRRIALVICDEGHLLDGGSRGVGLELLLARMRSREGGSPRFAFVSAIVPNIEEINIWLGGSSGSVVRSDYRPALAEYAVLRPVGSGAGLVVSLEMHPHEEPPGRFQIEAILTRADFRWRNEETRRDNTYSFDSMKTQAIAVARKALKMGAVAVFAANKRGEQGALGLADELIEQLQHELPLTEPKKFADMSKVAPAAKYLALEYGADWIGTKTLAAGAVLHHGDIPQETREVVELLLREQDVSFAICTNTLAEGVNLPIRTLVLYSVRRRQKDGAVVDLLARDIKNLVGRAGRAGATTKGLVICVSEQQWPLVEPVARQAAGEAVNGALRSFVEDLQELLVLKGEPLTNTLLEADPTWHTLVDGVDATVIDLIAEEIGDDALVRAAVRLADQTFAVQKNEPETKALLEKVFELRAHRIAGVRAAGRLAWIRETGARPRLVDAVETELLPRRPAWDDVDDPVDAELVQVILGWAWEQADLQQAVRDTFRLEKYDDTTPWKQPFFDAVRGWLSGARFKEVATQAALPLDDLLSLHTRAISFVLQALVEQALALLGKLLEAQERVLAPSLPLLAEHLRFGVPTGVARVLAADGVRHRSAAVELGTALVTAGAVESDRTAVFTAARDSILAHRDTWADRLGVLVVENTLWDLTSALGGGGREDA